MDSVTSAQSDTAPGGLSQIPKGEEYRWNLTHSTGSWKRGHKTIAHMVGEPDDKTELSPFRRWGVTEFPTQHNSDYWSDAERLFSGFLQPAFVEGLLCACMLNHFSCIWLFATLRTVAHQALLCMGFSRQGYWSGLSRPPPGDLPNSGIKPKSPMSPLAGEFFTTIAIWEASCMCLLSGFSSAWGSLSVIPLPRNAPAWRIFNPQCIYPFLRNVS